MHSQILTLLKTVDDVRRHSLFTVMHTHYEESMTGMGIVFPLKNRLTYNCHRFFFQCGLVLNLFYLYELGTQSTGV